MKRIFTSLLLLVIVLTSSKNGYSQVALSYYLPQNVQYNQSIPKPNELLGYQVGEWHVSHDQIVSYFRQLAQVSGRIKYEVYGKTHEGRPLTVAIISSEANIKRLEEIRRQHLQLSDPSLSSKVNIDELPVVVWLSHSIHGNEASGANSALLTGYYFAAATGKEIDDLLDKTIIIIDPATNPDGIHRFSGWVNANKSIQGNTDPLSREHNEAWPGGRTNHYWFDLNRDWLPIEQPESENRIKKLLTWKPNILVDQHEQGTNATFHFSPGEPNRVNPLIPKENQELTQKLADNYAKAFDAIGTFYTSGERYDDYYIGRGPTFLDLNGGVSLLFEQASVRGFAQESDNGLLTFPYAIRNQFTGELSTVKTAFNLRKDFINYQKKYYSSAIDDAGKSVQKAYVFGSEYDHTTTFKLAQFLSTHGIKSYLLKRDVNTAKQSFKSSQAYVVPLDQPQYRLIQSIFGIHKNPKDSIFYDVSAWNIPQAYNLPFDGVASYSDLSGDEFSVSQQPKGKIIGSGTAYAYIFKWEDYNAPKALFRLEKEGIIVKVANESFETLDGLKFDRGAILIPLGVINTDQTKVDKIIAEITEKDGIDVYRLNTGDNKSVDLGSPSFSKLTLPRIAILTEDGVNAIGAGQIWHLLDTKYNIPVTLLPVKLLRSADLDKFNVIVLPDGNYQALDARVTEKIQNWTASGNTLIAIDKATTWLNSIKLVSVDFKKDEDKAPGLDYKNTLVYNASREVPGSVFETKLDLTHPINYGFKKDKVPFFKDNDLIQIKTDDNGRNYPVKFTKSSLLDGYAPTGFEKALGNTPAFGIFASKRGRVVAFYNNINFRGYWLGTNRFFANALFFGDIIRLSSGFNRE
ncbi:MAG: M14 family metallopeptidase [Bacteroidota bacterium]|nr:M14 family metallopeptidase [Bacteroidota bacterium]